jgi:class 3 adenylate cyclase/tetratricopeptide (TPR) repeat protein
MPTYARCVIVAPVRGGPRWVVRICVRKVEIVGSGVKAFAQTPPASGERRQVTVLFADMVGFVEVSERIGEDATFSLIRQIYELLTAAIKDQGGWAKDFTGDGVMALFGASEALEDAPLRACRAGLSIHQRLSAAASTFESQFGIRPQMRIGVNSGLAVVAKIFSQDATVTALGDTVNLASRLQKLAEPGAVYLSESTRRLIEGQAETAFVGDFNIRGKSDPQKVYRLVSVRPGTSRFETSVFRGLSAYVGRERELQVLERSLAEARRKVCIIDIVAEPGMGKSRLLYEFRRRLNDGRAFLLQGSCSPDGRQTPFRTFIEVVRDLFQIGILEPEGEVRRKIEQGLASLELNSAQTHGLLLNMIGLKPPDGALSGLDGVLIRMRTREILQRLLEARCRRSSVALLIEDIHWIDRASEDVLSRIASDDARLGLLILHTRRPEYQPPWSGGPSVTALRLDPLSAEDIQRLVQTRLGVDAMPQPLARIVTEKAEGNALFAEEIASFLIENNVLRVSNGALEFDLGKTTTLLPASIQLLLSARVGSLAAEDREVLQVASVIGRSFDYELLAAIVGRSRDLMPHLAAAEAADLLRYDSAAHDFSFKHVLLRDALYDSMLASRRAELHLRVAHELERRRANQLIEVAEILAHHYSFTEEAGKTFEYRCLSARKSLGVYSLEEAEKHFREALAVLDRTPGCVGDEAFANAVAGLLEVLHLKGDVREEKSVADRYLPKLEQAAASPQFVFALHIQSMILAHAYEFERAEATSRRALEIALQIGDARAAGYARHALMFCSTLLGRWSLDDAERFGAELIANAEQVGDNYLLNWAYWSVAWDYLFRGLIAEARVWAHKLIESGRQRDDRRTLAMAYWTLGWIDLAGERFEEAIRDASECIKTAVTRFDVVTGNYVKATAELLSGQIENALTRLQEQREWLETNGWVFSANGADCSIGTALALGGRVKEAIRYLNRAITVSDEHGDVYAATWNRIALAEIYLAIVANSGKPSLRVLTANLGAIVTGKLRGAQRALVLLEQARNGRQVHEQGVLRARIDFDVGLLLERTRQFDVARQRLLAARAAAETQDVPPMVARIDVALARLPAAAAIR